MLLLASNTIAWGVMAETAQATKLVLVVFSKYTKIRPKQKVDIN